MLSFLLLDKGRLFTKLSFEEFEIFFLAERLVCFETQPSSEVLKSHRQIFYSIVNQMTSSKANLCICQYFMDVSVVRFKIGLSAQTWDLSWILPSLCSADFSCVNGSTSQLLLRELLLKINWWVFLIQFFEKQFLCLLLYGVLSLIT